MKGKAEKKEEKNSLKRAENYHRRYTVASNKFDSYKPQIQQVWHGTNSISKGKVGLHWFPANNAAWSNAWRCAV